MSMTNPYYCMKAGTPVNRYTTTASAVYTTVETRGIGQNKAEVKLPFAQICTKSKTGSRPRVYMADNRVESDQRG